MAMGRQKDGQGDLMVSWSEMPRSPGHVFYDRLQSVLVEGGFDAFAEASCRPYYAARMGAPSVPPGRYFRMHLVGYFEGIDSERGLEWRCSDSLSLRAFLRLGSRDRVPDHSWLSRSRTRLPHEVHAAVFDWVLVLIAEAVPAPRRRPQSIVTDAPAHRRRHPAGGRGGRIWRYFRSAHAHRSHAGGTGGLAKRPDGFRRRILHLGVRAGKSHLINGLLNIPSPGAVLNVNSGRLPPVHVCLTRPSRIMMLRPKFGAIRRAGVTMEETDITPREYYAQLKANTSRAKFEGGAGQH